MDRQAWGGDSVLERVCVQGALTPAWRPPKSRTVEELRQRVQTASH